MAKRISHIFAFRITNQQISIAQRQVVPLGDIRIYVDIANHGIFFDKDKAMAMSIKIHIASNGMTSTSVRYIFRTRYVGRENHLRFFVKFKKSGKTSYMVTMTM